MKIKILGTRGEIEPSVPYHSKHSGILIDNTLMVDLGEKEFLKHKPKYILITHLHPDHAFFVLEETEIKIPIYAPEKYEGMDIKVLKKKTKIGPYRVTPVPTIHSLKVKSNAYVIEKGGKRILYTGDVAWLEKKHRHLLGDLDLVITEASYVRKGGLVLRSKKEKGIYGHTGVPDFIRIFKDHTPKIVFTHFGSWFYKNVKKAKKKLEELGKENGIEVITGYDGMEIKV
jgi:ribonuclease BN (tRNA processing enzyme)